MTGEHVADAHSWVPHRIAELEPQGGWVESGSESCVVMNPWQDSYVASLKSLDLVISVTASSDCMLACQHSGT